jgi:hypothetical protein
VLLEQVHRQAGQQDLQVAPDPDYHRAMTARRSIEGIVEEQVKRWQLERQRRPAAEPQVATTITVSRQYGARGGDLARSLADRLGFQCWDQELVHDMASHARVPDALIASLDEHRATAIGEALAFFAPGKLTTGDYRRELLRVIHTLGAHGGAVIVGRGAHYVLPPASTLRIRVVAPLSARVATIAQRQGIPEAAARTEIDRIDTERADFMRQQYDRDITDPTHFDLLLNTATLTLDQATEIAAAAHRTRFGTPASR